MDIDFAFWLTVITLFSGICWGVQFLGKFLAVPPLGLIGYIGSFFPVLLLVLVLRSFLAEPFKIPSESMVPTLEVGDFILVNKFTYGLRLPVLGIKFFSVGDPERGDVLVFIPRHDNRYFIKRVVGLPGDKVTYKNQKLFINNRFVTAEPVQLSDRQKPFVRTYVENLDESAHYIQLDTRKRGAEGEWIVPRGHYFVLGDNRNLSEDSRYWGFVAADAVVGRAFAIWMHKDIGWSLPTFGRNGLIL